MIHRIRVSNFYSIRDEQIIDLRVPGNAPESAAFRLSPSRPNTRLPTVVALFGPNASGKSTVLRLIWAVTRFLTVSFKSEPQSSVSFIEPFLDRDGLDCPTCISIEFDAAWVSPNLPRFHSYDLEVGPKDGRRVVLRESLRWAPEGRIRMRRIFEREGNAIVAAPELGTKGQEQLLNAVRDNASVVSTLAQLNNMLCQRICTDLSNNVRTNFYHVMKGEPDHDLVLGVYENHPSILNDLNSMIDGFDLGIKKIRIGQERGPRELLFEHKNLVQPLSFLWQSQGTQKLVRNFPIIYLSLQFGGLAVLDEIDADLHPHMMAEIVRWFHDPSINRHAAQLWLALHNPSIMDELEKEEIFFTERSDDGATQIFGAKSIKGLRREPSLSRAYLGGALGAVPIIG